MVSKNEIHGKLIEKHNEVVELKKALKQIAEVVAEQQTIISQFKAYLGEDNYNRILRLGENDKSG